MGRSYNDYLQNKIKLQEIYNITLEMSFTADACSNHINNNNYQEIILDFTGITFMSLSFTQEYVYQEIHTTKKITQINMHEDIKPMLDKIINIINDNYHSEEQVLTELKKEIKKNI